MEKIETARLTLRAPEKKDAPAMLEIRNSGYVRRYNPMALWELPRMEKEIAQEIERGSALYIEGKETGALMGGIWLEPDGLRYGPKAYTISYYLAQEEAGKGYMTEALLAFIPWAFEELRADLLSARVFAPNKGSARLLQKVGFVHEGTLRRAVAAGGVTYDDMLFSLLPEDWKV